MIEKTYDAVIIGGGSAGMAAAAVIAQRGFSCAIVERESGLGGILTQCIHNGFGLHYFKEELSGPEFAERFERTIAGLSLDVFLDTTVMEVDEEGDKKVVFGYSKIYGIVKMSTRSVVLAMGCRERNRGNIGTPGTRPSGVFTAGLAQRLVNIDGYIPGKDVVIVGSGDIGLIMARRMTWVGASVKAVIEIQPYPAGLTRNIVQCLTDFGIPLYLSHVDSEIRGKDRVESVLVSPLKDGVPDDDASFVIPCDTVLLSVGLVPDNEISKKFGVMINPETGGAFVDAWLMTSVRGVFACGNVLHVHDLVDYVCEEAERCAGFVCSFLKGESLPRQIRVRGGSNVKYTVPNQCSPEHENRIYLRPLVVKNKAELVVACDGEVLKTRRLAHVQPSEMISVELAAADFSGREFSADSVLEVGIR